MDWMAYLSTNGFALLILFLIIALVILAFTTPWSRRFHCPECGKEFYNEEEAAGHLAVHMKHKPIED